MRELTYDEKNAIGRGIALTAFVFGLMVYGLYALLEHDRNKMLAFVAKCESNGNHAVFRNVDRGACFAGPVPKIIEEYHEF